MENNNKGILNFLKKYGYYLLALTLILGITLTVSLATKDLEESKDDVPTSTPTAIVFGLPIDSPTVLKWYSDSELMYNSTLNQWESHKGVDLVPENENNVSVYSVLDGVVTDVQESYEYGTIVKISHDNGFVSVYSSLDSELNIDISDSVKKGDKIGEISDSASNEQKTGKHLHFELFKDGKKVDPSNYISLENK